MISVYKRELRSFFSTLSGFVAIAFFLLFAGIFITVMNLFVGSSSIESSYSTTVLVYLIAIPILTMKIISEDKKTRTDLLLRTLPLKTIDYVLGKYLALITMIFIPTAIIFSYTLILSFYGSVNIAAAISGTLALFLCGCALGALGMFISSLTDNTVISAVFCFGAMLLIYFMPTVILLLPKNPISAVIFFIILGILCAYAVYRLCKSIEGALITLFVFALGSLAVYAIDPSLLEGLLPRMFSALSVTERFEIFASNAILDLSAILYFITFAFIFVFLTHQSCEKARLG